MSRWLERVGVIVSLIDFFLVRVGGVVAAVGTAWTAWITGWSAPWILLVSLAAFAILTWGALGLVKLSERRRSGRVETGFIPETLPLLRSISINFLENRPITTNELTQIDRLWQDINTWERDVIEALSNADIPRDEVSEVRDLGDLYHTPPGVIPDTALAKNIIAEKRRRLETIIHRRRAS